MEPYPFQLDGIQYLQSHHRVLLGDDRGVGKTVQALRAVIRYPVLVLAPKVLLRKWEQEIRTWRLDWQDLSIAILDYGETSKSQAALLSNPDIVICNYEGLLRLTALTKRTWGTLICDEAHRLKNRRALTTKKAQQIRASDTFLLTANGVTGTPEDLWSLLHLLSPQEFRSFWSWVDEYCLVVLRQYRGTAWPVKEVVGWKDPKLVLPLLRGRYLRRTKEEVLPQLPPRTIVSVPVTLPDDERLRYHHVEHELLLELADNQWKVVPDALQRVGRLRQLLAAPNTFGHEPGSKQRAAADLVRTLLETEKRVVVFTWYRDAATGIAKLLEDVDAKIDVINGDVPMESRWSIVQAFQQDTPEQRVIIATLATLSEGVDLYRAACVVFLEKAWRPDQNEQAMDRVHRIGQDRPVTIYELRAIDTVDESLEKVLRRKERISDEVWISSAVLQDRLSKL